jgi:hypothetical protein
MVRLSALLKQSHQFIHTFCDPDAFSGHFAGDLGAWTPCFIDVGLLGECCAEPVEGPTGIGSPAFQTGRLHLV